MIFRKKQPLPPRDFPLVLRQSWRTDCPARRGRLRALAGLALPRTPRPLTMAQKARLRRFVLTFADIQRVEGFGLHRVPQDVAEEVARLRTLRDARAVAAE